MKRRRGNNLGFIIFDFYLSLGIRHAYALLYFVALHYLIFDRKAVQASRRYIDARFNSPSWLMRIKHTYSLFLNTGKNLIDLRQFERAPEKVRMECDTTRIRQLISKGKGVLMLTAHAGNWQIMMRNLPDLGAKVNIVMLPEENPSVREYLKIDQGEQYGINIIDPSKGVDAALEIMKELSAGNIVSMMGDKVIQKTGNLQLKLFGSPVSLPEGPFLIAASANSPLLFLISRKDDICRYTLMVNEITLPEKIKDKKEKTYYIATEYMKILEDFLKEYPYEWTPAGTI